MPDNFHHQNAVAWTASIEQSFGQNPPTSAQWTDLESIVHVLTPFMGNDLNHVMLPGGGGMDMTTIAQSTEQQCLEFTQAALVADIFNPAVLYFEYFHDGPLNSFFVLEVAQMQPCGVYLDSDGKSEEVVEYHPGEYISRFQYDSGILGYDGDGNEIPLPPSARIVTRHLQSGKFLIVAKQSLWNRDTTTYDGRHNSMNAHQVRDIIRIAINGQ